MTCKNMGLIWRLIPTRVDAFVLQAARAVAKVEKLHPVLLPGFALHGRAKRRQHASARLARQGRTGRPCRGALFQQRPQGNRLDGALRRVAGGLKRRAREDSSPIAIKLGGSPF